MLEVYRSIMLAWCSSAIMVRVKVAKNYYASDAIILHHFGSELTQEIIK